MLPKFFKKEKPRVYIDKLVVSPRDEIKKIDQWGAFKYEDLEAGIREKLNGLIQLPHISSRETIQENDLALEVVIINLQGGELGNFNLDDLGGIPFFWRPKIEIAARLYNLSSDTTHSSFKMTEKMPWSNYFSGLISINGILRYKPLFSTKDLEPLLYRACEKTLIKLTKSI
ncbi:MAG: hypothetical protein ACRBHB_16590 [Arenicella sp.]